MVHLVSYNHSAVGPVALQWPKKQKIVLFQNLPDLIRVQTFTLFYFFPSRFSKHRWNERKLNLGGKKEPRLQAELKWTATFTCPWVFTQLHSETKYHPLWSIHSESLSQTNGKQSESRATTLSFSESSESSLKKQTWVYTYLIWWTARTTIEWSKLLEICIIN